MIEETQEQMNKMRKPKSRKRPQPEQETDIVRPHQVRLF